MPDIRSISGGDIYRLFVRGYNRALPAHHLGNANLIMSGLPVVGDRIQRIANVAGNASIANLQQQAIISGMSSLRKNFNPAGSAGWDHTDDYTRWDYYHPDYLQAALFTDNGLNASGFIREWPAELPLGAVNVNSPLLKNTGSAVLNDRARAESGIIYKWDGTSWLMEVDQDSPPTKKTGYGIAQAGDYFGVHIRDELNTLYDGLTAWVDQRSSASPAATVQGTGINQAGSSSGTHLTYASAQSSATGNYATSGAGTQNLGMFTFGSESNGNFSANLRRGFYRKQVGFNYPTANPWMAFSPSIELWINAFWNNATGDAFGNHGVTSLVQNQWQLAETISSVFDTGSTFELRFFEGFWNDPPTDWASLVSTGSTTKRGNKGWFARPVRLISRFTFND